MRPRHSLSAVNEGGVNYHDDIYGVGTHVARYKTNGMSACHCFGSRLKKRARCTRCHKVKGEVAVTAGFVPFKAPGSPVVEKTVFPSPLSYYVLYVTWVCI